MIGGRGSTGPDCSPPAAAAAAAAASSGGGASAAAPHGIRRRQRHHQLLALGLQPAAGLPGLRGRVPRANPNITVKITQYGWDDYWDQDHQRLHLRHRARTCSPTTCPSTRSSSQKQLIPLSDALTADGVNTDIYQPGLRSLWTAPGRQDLRAAQGLRHRRAVLQQKHGHRRRLHPGRPGEADLEPHGRRHVREAVAHLTIDKNGKRGDEAGLRQDQGRKTYGLGLEDGSAGNGQTQWSTFTGSNGWKYTDKNPWGTHYNYDQATFQDTLTWYRSLIDKGYMPRRGNVTAPTPATTRRRQVRDDHRG